MINFSEDLPNKLKKVAKKSPEEEMLDKMNQDIKTAIDSGSDPYTLTKRRNELLGKIKAQKGISQ